MSVLVDKCELWNRLASANDKAEIFAIINDMPAVAERPGHWKYISLTGIVQYECSVCGDSSICRYNYCPRCGTCMDAEQHEGGGNEE